MVWIDYKKAFDSIPHSWIIEVLKVYNICPIITEFIKNSMKKWRTKMCLHHEKGLLMTETIAIKRGIFQGDSLSTLLFCIALFPFSQLLNHQQFGHNIGLQRITHLLYMDDLKLFMKNKDQMKEALMIIENFSSDIQITFGLSKCAAVEIKKRKSCPR